MNLVAIALLCQVVGTYSHTMTREEISDQQLSCQKEYVDCWNKKRKEQLKAGKPFDGEQFLAQCVLEHDS